MSPTATPLATQTPPKRQSRVALLLAIGLFCFAMFCLYGVWSQSQFQARCREIGARLTATLRSDSRFHDTQVHVTTRPDVFVTAPDELPAATKADLEHIAAEVGGSLHIRVSYLIPIPDSPAPTQNP